MGCNMDTENLRTFIALTKHKNFTKTAESMFVAQSTVTNRIAELEKEVGKKLFERERKNIYLTEEGKRFLDYAIRITDLEKAAVDDINTGDRYRFKLNIGSTNTIYDCHLKDKLTQFVRDNPDIALKVIISHSMSLNQMAADGVVDFAFTCVQYKRNDVDCIPYCDDEMILVTDKANTEFSDGIRLSELTQINCLYCNFTLQGISKYIKDLFPKNYRFSFEIDRSANIIPYLYDSDGYSFLPKNLVAQDIKDGKLIEIPLLDFEIPTIKSFIISSNKGNNLDKEFKKQLLNLMMSV